MARSLPAFSRTKLSKLIDAGDVRVNGKPVKSSFPLEPGMRVELAGPPKEEPHDLTPADIPLDIVYEDASLLVVNKPRGLAAHPASSLKEPSLVNALLGRNTQLSSAAGEFRPGIVHRLDKDTTGLMVVAKDDVVHAALARQLESKTAERRYFAIVSGELEQDRFVIDFPIGRSESDRRLMTVSHRGRRAVTHIKRLVRLDQGTLLAARLETGRTHQIRVHLRAIGHPVLGDNLYAPKEHAEGPMQLHAGYLAFDHPASGERVAFYAPPDGSFYGHDRVSRKQLEEF